MSSLLRSTSIFLLAMTITVGITTAPIRAADESKALQDQVDKLAKKVAKLEAKLANVKLVQGTINGLAGPHFIFEGCNVHVRSGSGDSTDGTVDLAARTIIPDTAPAGLGNLVVGYNEQPNAGGVDRGGSHNLIVGPWHAYSSVGGAVFGHENSVTGPLASVTSGFDNEASGIGSSVSGGLNGAASGNYSSVSGGQQNTASATFTSVSGGSTNRASFGSSSISGGYNNQAMGDYANVSGGHTNSADGDYSSISGGRDNIADGTWSSVSGGGANTASGLWSSVSGGNLNDASNNYSSVSGGYDRNATGVSHWRAGSLFETD